MVKAATPFWMNSRRVGCMADALHELILAGAHNQVHEAGRLVRQLGVGPRPRTSCPDVVEECRARGAVVLQWREPVDRMSHQGLRAGAGGPEEIAQVELLV